MAALDVFLEQTMTRAKAEFPNLGLLLISVEDTEDDEVHEITLLTNLLPAEVDEVLAELPSMETDEIELKATLHS